MHISQANQCRRIWYLISIVFLASLICFGLFRYLDVPLSAAGQSQNDAVVNTEQNALFSDSERKEAQAEVEDAWQLVTDLGSYQYSTDIIQQTIPLALVTNVGRTSKNEAFHIEGSTNLPDKTMNMVVWAEGGSLLDRDNSYEVKVENNQTFSRQGEGDWQLMDSFVEMAAPQGDFLGFLSVAENVQFSESRVINGNEIKAYAFEINAPRFAVQLREQIEKSLGQRGELPAGFNLSTPEIYVNMQANGKLWIDADGLPVRQVIHLVFPPGSETRVETTIDTTFKGFDREQITVVKSASPMTRLMGGFTAGLQASLPVVILLLVSGGLVFFILNHPLGKRLTAPLTILFIVVLVISPLLESAQAAAFYKKQTFRQTQSVQADLEKTAILDSNPQVLPGYQAAIYTSAPRGVGTLLGIDPSVDTDGDGLTDAKEALLGTDPNNPDTDGDLVSDGDEANGFTYNGQLWVTDPNHVDTNRDGLVDGVEWNNADLFHPTWDLDGDGVPDLFDLDNDGDGVPDSLDLSPATHSNLDSSFGAGNTFSLILNGLTKDTRTFVEFQLRPTNPDHLWYALSILDWPADAVGQYQDRDNASLYDAGCIQYGTNCEVSADEGDMRMIPMLEIKIPSASPNLPLTAPILTFDIAPLPDKATSIEGAITLEQKPWGVGSLVFQTISVNSGYETWKYWRSDRYCGEALPSGTGATIPTGEKSTGISALPVALKYYKSYYFGPSVNDLRACANVPVATFVGNKMVDADYLEHFGISVREMDEAGSGKIIYLPLNLVTDPETGAQVAFQGEMMYLPSGIWNAAHQVNLVWTVQMLNDTATEFNISQIIQTYSDDWVLTGLNVREDHGVKTAVVYEDPAVDANLQDDLPLLSLAQGLGGTFLAGRACYAFTGDGECIPSPERDTGVDQIYTRFNHATNDDGDVLSRWGISDTLTVVPKAYTGFYEMLVDLAGATTTELLSSVFDPHWSSATPISPTLLFATETNLRSQNLDFPASTGSPWSGGELTLSLAGAPLITQAHLRIAPYKYFAGEWRTFPIGDYLTELGNRYAGEFDGDADTQLGKMYVFQIYYMALYSGLSSIVEESGVPDQNFDTMIVDKISDPTQARNAAKFVVNVVFSVWIDNTTVWKSVKATFTNLKYSASQIKLPKLSVKNGVIAAAVVAGIVTASVLTFVDFGGDGEGGTIPIAATATVLGGVLTGYGLYSAGLQLAQEVKTIKNLSKLTGASKLSLIKGTAKMAKGAAVVGLVVEVGVAWTVFIFEVANGSDPNKAAAAAGGATTVAVIYALIALIPFVGEIIVGLLILTDLIVLGLCQLGVEGACKFGGIAQTLATFFAEGYYSEDLNNVFDYERDDLVRLTNLNIKPVGPIQSFTAGVKVQFSLDAEFYFGFKGPIYEKGVPYYPTSASYELDVRAALEAVPVGSDDISKVQFVATHSPVPIWKYGEAARTKDPAYSFYSLHRLNLTNSAYLMNYTTDPLPVGINTYVPLYFNLYLPVRAVKCWSKVGGISTGCESANTSNMISNPVGNDGGFYFDILPATIEGLASWDQLQSRDRDGDRLAASDFYLCSTFSQLCGNDPDDTKWDTDGDGISDRVELEQRSAGILFDLTKRDTDGDEVCDADELRLGTNPNSADTDGDSLPDGVEVFHQVCGTATWSGGWRYYTDESTWFWVTSNPRLPDTDGDGLSDALEKNLHEADKVGFPYNPQVYNQSPLGITQTTDDDDNHIAAGEMLGFYTTLNNNMVNGYYADGILDTIFPLELGGQTKNARFSMVKNNSLSFYYPVAAYIGPTKIVSVDQAITAQVKQTSGVAVPGTLSSVSFDNPQLLITIDNDKPSTEVTSGEYVQAGGYRVIAGAATDPSSSIAHVMLSEDGGTTWLDTGEIVGYNRINNKEVWGYTLNIPNVETTKVIQTRATDAVGNVEDPVKTTTLKIDGTPPNVTTSQTGNPTIGTLPGTVRFAIPLTGSVADPDSGANPGSGIASVEIMVEPLNYNWQPANLTLGPDGRSGTWYIQYNLAGLNSLGNMVADPSGQYTVTVRATDNVNNVISDTNYLVYQVKVDGTPPVVTMDDPYGGPMVITSTTTWAGEAQVITRSLTLQGTVTDPNAGASGIQKVEISFTPAELADSLDDPVVLMYLNDPLNATDFANNGPGPDATCTIPHCPTATVPGIYGTAVNFDGTNDYLALTQDVSETGYTAAIWFKTSCSDCGILSIVQGSLGSTLHDRDIYLNNGNVCSTVLTNTSPKTWNTICTATGNFGNTSWHQAVQVIGPEGHKLYLDGVLQAESPAVHDSKFTAQTGLVLGFAPITTPAIAKYFNGSLDEFAIYDTAFSENEVASLYSRWQPVYLAASGAGVTTTTWTYDVPFGLEGFYQIDLRTEDVKGNRNDAQRTKWTQWQGVIDTLPPRITYTRNRYGYGEASYFTYAVTAIDDFLSEDNVIIPFNLASQTTIYRDYFLSGDEKTYYDALAVNCSVEPGDRTFDASAWWVKFGGGAQRLAGFNTNCDVPYHLSLFYSSGVNRLNRLEAIEQQLVQVCDVFGNCAATGQSQYMIYSAEFDGSYSSSLSNGRIERGPSNQWIWPNEVVLSTAPAIPDTIRLDLDAGKMYWTQYDPGVANSGAILRANLDGSNPETLLSGRKNPAPHAHMGLALDTLENRMYWTEGKTVYSANLDGSNVSTVFSFSFGYDDSSHIEYDQARGKLIWLVGETYPANKYIGYSFYRSSAIYEVNLNGSGLVELFTMDYSDFYTTYPLPLNSPLYLDKATGDVYFNYRYSVLTRGTISGGVLTPHDVPSESIFINWRNHVSNITSLFKDPLTNEIYEFIHTNSVDGGLVETINYRDADLVLTASDLAQQAAPGLTMPYGIQVRNAGVIINNNVEVQAQLPAQTTLLATYPSTIPCVENNHLVTCQLGQMASNEVKKLTFHVQIPFTATGSLAASFSVLGQAEDLDRANNAASTSTLVVAPPADPGKDYAPYVAMTWDSWYGGTKISSVRADNFLDYGDLKTGGSQVYSSPTYDPVGNKLYFFKKGVGIQQMNLDGSGEATLISLPTGNAKNIRVFDGYVYWYDGALQIMRAPISSPGAAAAIINEPWLSGGFAISPVTHELYWFNPTLMKSNLDGTGVQVVSEPCRGCPDVPLSEYASLGLADGIHIDPYEGRIYFIRLSAVYRMFLNGSGMEKIYQGTPGNIIPKLPLMGLTLDLDRRKVYWVETEYFNEQISCTSGAGLCNVAHYKNELHAVNFDGSGIENFSLPDTGRGTGGYGKYLTEGLAFIPLYKPAPTALDDTYGLWEDPVQNIPGPGVLDNDLDPDASETLAVTGYQAVSQLGAVVSVSGAGGFTYDASAVPAVQSLPEGAQISDTFVYTAAYISSDPVSATVTLVITGINDAPTAVNDSGGAISEDSILVGTGASRLMLNDYDIDLGDTFSMATYTTTSTNGAVVTITADGGYTYDPRFAPALQALGVGQTLVDSFDYVIADSHGLTSTGTVAVTVQGANDAPVAVVYNKTIDEADLQKYTLLFEFPSYIWSANSNSDIDTGDKLTFVGHASTSARGAVVGRPISYIITYDATGVGVLPVISAGDMITDTIVYTITDQHGAQSSSIILITINGANDPPTAVSDSNATNEDAALNVGSGAGVLVNDFDINPGDTITVTGSDSTSAYGALVSVQPDGGYSYDPTGAVQLQALAVGETLTDTFVYRVVDSFGAESSALVSIVVSGVNDAPTAVKDLIGATKTSIGSGTAPGLLGNDRDPEDDVLTAVPYTGTTTLGAAITVLADGSFAYDPSGSATIQALAAGASITDTFTYTATDGEFYDTAIVDVAISGRQIYWTDKLDIYRSPQTVCTTACVEVLAVLSAGDIGSLALDVGEQWVYYTWASGIYRMNFTGTVTETLVTGLTEPLDLKLDLANGQMYWTDHGASLIQRANLDGSNVVTLTAAVADPFFLAVDLDQNLVFWTQGNSSDQDHRLYQATLTGDVLGAPQAVYTSTFRNFCPNDTCFGGLTIGAGMTGTTRLYFTVSEFPPAGELDGHTIRSCDTSDCMNTVTVLTKNGGFSGFYNDKGSLAVRAPVGDDFSTGRIFWVSFGDIYPLDQTVAPSGPGGNYLYVMMDNLIPDDASVPTVVFSTTLDYPDSHFGIALSFETPVAYDDSGVTSESAVLTATAPGVMANDTAEYPLLVTASSGTSALGAPVTVVPDGSYIYTPTQVSGFNSLRLGVFITDTFTYTVRDTNHYGASAIVHIRVNGENDAPTAFDDQFATDEDKLLSVNQAGGVLSNDTDPDSGDTKTVFAFDALSAAEAIVLVQPNGSFTYDPTASGVLKALAMGDIYTDTFTYTMQDSQLITSTAVVTVVVTGVNDAPMGEFDQGDTSESAVLTVGAPGVLANDQDPDTGDVLVVNGFISPTLYGAAVAVFADGSYVYTPTLSAQLRRLANGAQLTDIISYTVSDGNGGTDEVAIEIVVTGDPNASPEAVADSYATDEESSFIIPAPGVLANDTDPNGGDSLTVSSADSASLFGALVAVNADGSFTYTPAGAAALQSLSVGEQVTDVFSYTVYDQNDGYDTAVVSITVTGVNDVPTAVPDTGETIKDAPFVTAAPGLLANDSDPDTQDVLQVVTNTFTSSLGAGVVLFGDGSYQYDPLTSPTLQALGSEISQIDVFTYTLDDGQGGLVSGSVTITVTGLGQLCAVDEDINEPNDLYTQATFLFPESIPTDNSFHSSGDQDWYAFELVAGRQYQFQTQLEGLYLDTTLALYGPDGTTLLLSNDDTDAEPYSTLVFEPDSSGVYYLLVEHKAAPNLCTHSYQLSLADITPAPKYPEEPGYDAPLLFSTIVYPYSGSTLTNTAPISVTVGVYAVESAQTITVTLNGAALETSSWASGTLTDSAWSTTWVPTGEGVYTLTAALSDWAGHVQTETIPIKITVDTSYPSVTLTTQAITTAHTTVPFAAPLIGTAMDTLGVAQVEVDPGGAGWQFANVSAGDWQFQWDLEWNPDGETIPVFVRVIDLANQVTEITQNVFVDISPPSAVTVTLALSQSSGNVVVSETQTIYQANPTMLISWTASTDGYGLAGYFVGWTTSPTATLTELTPYADASLAHVQVLGEAEIVYAHIVVIDNAGNQRVQTFGPFYIDGPATPDLIVDLDYQGWRFSGATQLSADQEIVRAPATAGSMISQTMFASWDADALRLDWVGGDWDHDGDMFIYLDTESGGATRLYNPYTTTASTVITLPTGMTADALIWVQTNQTATLLTWDGIAWVASQILTDAQYRWTETAQAQFTGLYLPFALLQIDGTDSLGLLAVASEENALQLWAAAPDRNPLNSPVVINTGALLQDLSRFSLLHYFSWPNLALGVLVNENRFENGNLSLTIAASPAGTQLGYLESDLLNLLNPSTPLDADLDGVVDVALPFDLDIYPVNLGQMVTYTITYVNTGPYTLTEVSLVMTATDTIILNTSSPFTVSIGSVGPGITGTVVLTGIVQTNADHKAVELDIALSDQTHGTYEWFWLHHAMDTLGPDAPEFYLIDLYTPPYTQTIGGQTWDPSGTPIQTLEIDPQSTRSITTLTCFDTYPMDSSWGCHWNPELFSDSDWVKMRVRSTDSFGNEGTWSEWITLTIDSQPPTITVDPAFDGAIADGFIGPDEARIFGQITDNYAATGYEVCEWQSNLPVCNLYEIISPTLTANWSYGMAVLDQDGTPYTITLRSQDAANNYSSPLTRTFLIDSIPPVITSTQTQVQVDVVNYLIGQVTGGPILAGSIVDGGAVGTLVMRVIFPNGEIAWQPVAAIGNTWFYTPVLTLAGEYLFNLEASDQAGNLSVGETFTLTVEDQAITGLQAIQNGPTLLGSATSFTTSITTGTNVAYDWDFGDGHAGSGAYVAHTYASAGIFTVVVTASNQANQVVTSLQVTVQETIGGLNIFSSSPTALGQATLFTATVSAGTNTSYTWDFGDGQFGSGSTIANTYATFGSYTVVVTASNQINLVTGTIQVDVEEVITGMSAQSSSPTPLGQFTSLTAVVESGTGVSYTWDFGDGQLGSGAEASHLYAAPGSYTAVVTASNQVSLITDTVVIIVQESISSLNASSSSPTAMGQATLFTATVSAGTNTSFTWNFGDGQFGSGSTTANTYAALGSYTVVITASNQVSLVTGIIQVDVEEVITGLNAQTSSPTPLGQSTSLTATVESGTGVSYTWDFGDGQLGSGTAASHLYAAPGSYTAVVTASNKVNSVTTNIEVLVQQSISGLIASNDGPTTSGLPATLSAEIISGTAVSYGWDFGDGITGTGQTVTHTYASAGIYTATVFASNLVSQQSAETQVTVNNPGLNITVTISESPVILGAEFVSQITVTNMTALDLSNLILLNPTIPELQFEAASSGCAAASSLITCTLGNLAGNSSVFLEITQTVAITAGDHLSSQFTVTGQTPSSEAVSTTQDVVIHTVPYLMWYENDFENGVGNEWCLPETSTTPTNRNYLGEQGNITNCLTLTSLPAHTKVQVDFDLFIIRSWQGSQQTWLRYFPFKTNGMTIANTDANEWLVLANDQTLMHTTFSNYANLNQAYPGSYPVAQYPGRTGAAEVNTLGYTYQSTPLDSVYRIRLTFDHVEEDLVLEFLAKGLVPISGASWGLDNVRVIFSAGADLQPYKIYLPLILR